MNTFEESLQIVMSQPWEPTFENVNLEAALGRILAEDVVSDMDMPPFNKSAMDGFACRKEDLNSELTVIEEIAAGSVPSKILGTAQCARIMTGAMVPEGANFVIMKEHAEETAPNLIKRTRESNNHNICFRGEDIKAGETIIKRGIRILPQHIATMASVGAVKPAVYQQPSIAVLSTGSELVEASKKPAVSQIRNSNGYQLQAQVTQMGLPCSNLGIVHDSEEQLTNVIANALQNYQVLIISGGVSVGDYDLVPGVLKKSGVELLFHGMRAKPGKHLLFGRKDNCFVLGMPGNPVSSFIQFEILVKPLLYKLTGYSYQPLRFSLPLNQNFKRKKNDVLEFVPVFITDKGNVETIEYHGSAHISAYTGANGILEIPLGTFELNKGEKVHVRPL